MIKQVRLLKVAVQPIFVLDDGENLTESPGQSVTINAVDWSVFATSAFSPEELEQIRQHLEAASGQAADATEQD